MIERDFYRGIAARLAGKLKADGGKVIGQPPPKPPKRPRAAARRISAMDVARQEKAMGRLKRAAASEYTDLTGCTVESHVRLFVWTGADAFGEPFTKLSIVAATRSDDGLMTPVADRSAVARDFDACLRRLNVELAPDAQGELF